MRVVVNSEPTRNYSIFENPPQQKTHTIGILPLTSPTPCQQMFKVLLYPSLLLLELLCQQYIHVGSQLVLSASGDGIFFCLVLKKFHHLVGNPQ